MDTVRILDSYRLAVTRDPQAVRLLALLHRAGPLNEKDIATQASISVVDTREKLTELFRANLILLIDPTRYATSELAEMILANFGVPELATLELMRHAPLSDVDREFLASCIGVRENEPLEWRRYLATAARAMAGLEEWHAVVPDAVRRIWFATIVGLDPLSYEMGAEIYAQHVTANFGSSTLTRHLNSLRESCRVAIHDRAMSNEFLISGIDRRGDGDPSTTLALTFIRLAASSASRQIDEGVAAATAFHGIHHDAVRRLADWSRPIERECFNFWHEVSHRRTDAEPARLVYFLVDQLPYCEYPARLSMPFGAAEPVRVRSGSTGSAILAALRQIESTLEKQKLSITEAAEIDTVVGRIRKRIRGTRPRSGNASKSRRPRKK